MCPGSTEPGAHQSRSNPERIIEGIRGSNPLRTDGTRAETITAGSVARVKSTMAMDRATVRGAEHRPGAQLAASITPSLPEAMAPARVLATSA
jgi:hypothetical protein